jgi:hypothetical protein
MNSRTDPVRQLGTRWFSQENVKHNSLEICMNMELMLDEMEEINVLY